MRHHWTRAGLLLLLCGCPANSPSIQGPSDLPSELPLSAPPTGSLIPSPLVDPGAASFFLQMMPQTPCLDRPITLEGMNFSGARRVTIWLKGDTPEPATITGRYAIDHVPYAVKVADVTVGPQGGFSTTFDLSARMAPVSTGGYLALRPGAHYTLVAVDDAPGGGTRGMTFRLGGAEACSGGGEPSASLPALALEPAFPCHGEPVTVSGSGFGADTVNLEFTWEATRFGDGPTHSVSLPVEAGRLAYTFRLEEIKAQDGEPFFLEGRRYWVEVFDSHANTLIKQPIPVCNDELERALTAPSLPLTGSTVVRRHRDRETAEPIATEQLVIESLAEWEALLTRHSLDAEAARLLPSIDFGRQRMIAMVQPEGVREQQLEILAVEQAQGSLRVHGVLWLYPLPLATGGDEVLIALQPIPRSSEPVVFMPVAEGHSTQRHALQPARPEYARTVRVGRDGEVSVFPEEAP